MIVKPAPTNVPPAVTPPVVFNCSLPKSIVPLAEVIEEVPIAIFAISAVFAISIEVRPDKFVFSEIFNVSGDDTVAVNPVPVVTNLVLPEATACVFEPSDNIKPAAAIAIAFAAGRVPNETSKNHFDDLREHFEERQIVQIVAVISLFGFLNRWNDTMATQLESEPTEFAESVLSDGGWALGKHKG